MKGTQYTDDEIEYRINHARSGEMYCKCGKPLTTTKCNDCGGYAFESLAKLLDFIEGRSNGWDGDLVMSVARYAAMVPVLNARLIELTNQMDDLEKRQDSVWLKWVKRGMSAITVFEWLRRLLEFLRVRRRRTS